MCGIAGIFKFDGSDCSNEQLTKMTHALEHRGPNAEGYYLENSIGLAHRRLSIIDLSVSANQPFYAAKANNVLVFNGEVYNFQSLQNLLPGFEFKTSGDTEVVAELFSSLGVDSLQHLKGMFAFAFWNKQEETLWLVRDRMGVKPLYYYKNESTLLFSSELRSLLASGAVPKELDLTAVYDYLRFQSVQEPATLVKGIRQLPPGHFMKVNKQGISIHSYWNICEASKTYDYTSKEVIQQEVKSRLENAVELRLVSDVPIGAFLSGGIDSSAVVALMAQHSKSPVNTFNISFAEEDFDESIHAERVARKFNTLHHRIVLPPSRLLEELENALDAMDSPTGDGINTYVVSKAVKQEGLAVALSGIGGDELFAGYPFFWNYLKLKRLNNFWSISKPFRSVVAGILNNRHQGQYNSAAALLRMEDISIQNFYAVTRGILSPSQLSSYTRLSSADASNAEVVWNHKDYSKFPVLSQISMADLTHYTLNTLLKDTDQMSMSVALEVREPFFDHSLVEYVLGIPDAYKTGHSPKSLLVNAMGDLLPHEIVHRKKQGFTFPWNLWMKHELKQFCESKLTKLAQREFINSAALLDYWQQFLQGQKGIRWMELWLFVVLEYWLEKNMDA